MYRIFYISRVPKETKPNKINSGMLQHNDRDIYSVCIEAQHSEVVEVAILCNMWGSEKRRKREDEMAG